MAKFRDLDVANRGSSTKDEYVSEAFLVREVLYCCQARLSSFFFHGGIPPTLKEQLTGLRLVQGINGKYIFYNEQRQTFSFAERLNLSTPTVQLARRLCELGWLYIHIQGCLRGMGQRSQEAYRQGSVGQARHAPMSNNGLLPEKQMIMVAGFRRCCSNRTRRILPLPRCAGVADHWTWRWQ